jgi:hypothetical protein
MMAIRGGDPNRRKLIISRKIVEQVNTYSYLRDMLSYRGEKDVTTKLTKFLYITGIISQVLKLSKAKKQNTQ